MRGLVVVLLLGACGRLHIDPLGDDAGAETDTGAGAGVDVLPAVCVTDGQACDDGNICTASSACLGGTCVGPQTGPCDVANSIDDFATVQGQNGWYYGYWIKSNDADGTYQDSDFANFVYDGGVWDPPDLQPSGMNFTWAYLAWWGGHPGETPMQKLPIRRWISNVTGHAYAEVTHSKSDTASGDGTRAILFVDGVEVFSRDVAFDDGVGFVEAVPIELAIGTKVDLMIHYIGNEAADSTDSSMVIRSR